MGVDADFVSSAGWCLTPKSNTGVALGKFGKLVTASCCETEEAKLVCDSNRRIGGARNFVVALPPPFIGKFAAEATEGLVDDSLIDAFGFVAIGAGKTADFRPTFVRGDLLVPPVTDILEVFPDRGGAGEGETDFLAVVPDVPETLGFTPEVLGFAPGVIDFRGVTADVPVVEVGKAEPRRSGVLEATEGRAVDDIITPKKDK